MMMSVVEKGRHEINIADAARGLNRNKSYKGWVVVRTLYVRDRSSCSLRSVKFITQWKSRLTLITS